MDIIQFFSIADNQLLLAINGGSCNFLDFIMVTISHKFVWVPLYLYLVYVLYLREGLYRTVMWLVFVALCICFADQISSSLLKPMVGRLRPSNPDNPISAWVHVVDGYRGGRYGFPSSHAANSAALVSLWTFTYQCRTWCRILLVWAFLVGLSRIYLGVHYPSDVLAGWMLGAGIGYSMALLWRQILSNWALLEQRVRHLWFRNSVTIVLLACSMRMDVLL